MFLGCYELWMLRVWMLRILDATVLDALIVSMWQSCFEVFWSKINDVPNYLYLYRWHACKLCSVFSDGFMYFLAKWLKFTL